jgi:hypothetical protein
VTLGSRRRRYLQYPRVTVTAPRLRGPTTASSLCEHLPPRSLARWDVVDDAGVHAYDAWFFAIDSGVVFRAGTTDVVCIVVQFDFQSETDLTRGAVSARTR